MFQYSPFQSLPPQMLRSASPQPIRFPNAFLNYQQNSKSVSPPPHKTTHMIKQEINGENENIQKLLLENEQKAALCKEKEIEVEFWKKKYKEILEKNQGIDNIPKKEGESGDLDENFDLLDEYKQKLDKILMENEKLNKICDERLHEIEALKSRVALDVDPQGNNPEIYQEIHDLHEENIRVNRENLELKSKENPDMIEKLTEEKQQLKELLEKSSDNSQKLQERVKILLNENEKLNKLLNEKAQNIDFWKEKFTVFEESQQKYIGDLKSQLEINYQTASKMSKQQLNYDLESMKLKLIEMESKNSILSSENEDAKALLSELNEKYSELISKIDDYETNFIQKSVYNKEKSDYLSQIKRLENNVNQFIVENEKLLTLYNEKTSDNENWMSKYQNLEQNHTEHVKQLKKTWEISHNNNIELSVKEKTMIFRNDIENLELERENLLSYIRSIEEKNKENTEKIISFSQKFDVQKKRILQLEAEKERVEIYQSKIREIEEQHMIEMREFKENLIYERDSEQIQVFQEKIEILSEELTKMNRALDEKNNEIMQWNEKFRTYEEFHEMKIRDFQIKLENRNNQFRNENSGYINDLEKKLEFFQEEKIQLIEEIEKWRGNSLELEKKLNNITIMENKLEIMGNQNLALNKSLSTQMQENTYWKGQILEQEKLTQYLFEMENKIKYLMAENERLNRIIIMRCRDMMNN